MRKEIRSGLFLMGVMFFILVSSVSLMAETITLKLNWIPGGDHCFYYVAKELGYYKQNGLDVKIERGQGSGDTVKRLDLGTVDIGLADSGTLAVARSKGAKVKVLAMIYSSSPNSIKTIQGSGIRTPKDLEGRTVGVPSGDAQRVLWPAFAKANGIDMDKVHLINVKPGSKTAALSSGNVDAVFDWRVGNYSYWKAGMTPGKLVIIPWADYGINPYGNAIMASEKTIKEHPDMLKRFLDATIKAWRWSLANPDGAVKILVKYVPAVKEANGLVRFVQDVRGLMDLDMIRRTRLGWIDQARMEESVGYINKYFDVSKPVTAEEMYTNRFLPDYSLPNMDGFFTNSEVYQMWKQNQ